VLVVLIIYFLRPISHHERIGKKQILLFFTKKITSDGIGSGSDDTSHHTIKDPEEGKKSVTRHTGGTSAQ
jgi:hypothetical protein